MKLRNFKKLNLENPYRPYRIRPFLSEQLDLFELVKITQQIANFQSCMDKTPVMNNDTCRIRK
jgi:hypothetical protein